MGAVNLCCSCCGKLESCGESCGIHLSTLCDGGGPIFIRSGMMNRIDRFLWGGREISLSVKFASFVLQPELTDLGMV